MGASASVGVLTCNINRHVEEEMSRIKGSTEPLVCRPVRKLISKSVKELLEFKPFGDFFVNFRHLAILYFADTDHDGMFSKMDLTTFGSRCVDIQKSQKNINFQVSVLLSVLTSN
jgi:hypothetical protein